MPEKLTIDVDRCDRQLLFQLSINLTDENGTGGGDRLAGPKYMGASRNLLSHVVTEKDARTIRRYLDRAFPEEGSDARA